MKNMHFTRTMLVALFLTLIGGSAFAQKQGNSLFLIVSDDGNLYGFINAKGTVIVKPQYANANEFSDGMAAVAVQDDELNFKYGFINQTGKLVIPTKYSEVSNFSEGVAFARLDGKWLLIDKKGKTVAKCNELDDYSNVTFFDFHDGMVLFRDGIGYIDKKGNYVWSYTQQEENNDYGYDNTEITDAVFDEDNVVEITIPYSQRV